MAVYLLVVGGTPSGSGLTETVNGLTVDFNVVARAGYVTTIGDGSTNPITVTHSLGTKDVSVEVFEVASPYESVIPKVTRPTTSTVVLEFGAAPTTNQYRVVITVAKGL